MTTVGWVGLGKLGLPCAVAMASRGIAVVGYDIDPERRITYQALRCAEPGFSDALAEAQRRRTLLGADDLSAMVAGQPDLVFVCVQTPHPYGQDGSTPAPEVLDDFDYTALRSAVASVVGAGYQGPLVVMSTVTPGTMDTCVRPLLHSGIQLIYNPAFPAMGSVIDDYLNPALVLIGADDPGCHECVEDLVALYRQVCRNEPAYLVVGIASAELAKLAAYNTFITTKIVFANALMEVCHRTGADIDEVTDVMAAASDRVTSARYLRGGMGDGGACHPRDLLAMADHADRVGVSRNIWRDLIEAREVQSQWLADLALHHASLARLDTVMVLGKAYKPGVAIEAGSPALLLGEQLSRRCAADGWAVKVLAYDPLVDGDDPGADVTAALQRPGVFVLATPHEQIMAWELPAGSVLIDPWRTTWAGGPGVTRILVGAR